VTSPIKQESWQDRLGHAIAAFLKNPYTNLFKGLVLIIIGVSEASTKLGEDMAHGQLRVGHGLIIIGFFSLLEPLPHLLEGLDAGTRYLSRHSAKPEQGHSESAAVAPESSTSNAEPRPPA
jgi:hypothetical protein